MVGDARAVANENTRRRIIDSAISFRRLHRSTANMNTIGNRLEAGEIPMNRARQLRLRCATAITMILKRVVSVQLVHRAQVTPTILHINCPREKSMAV